MDALRAYGHALRATSVRSRTGFDAKLEQLGRVERLYTQLAEARARWSELTACDHSPVEERTFGGDVVARWCATCGARM